MPESAKGQNKSAYDWLMGTGYDMAGEDSEWAAPICGISADRIRSWRRDRRARLPLYVVQGWGLQRRSNGELNCWSIMMLPLLTGQVGLPGTSNGCREGFSISLTSLPAGDNPIKAKIPVFLFTRPLTTVRDDGASTPRRDGRGQAQPEHQVHAELRRQLPDEPAWRHQLRARHPCRRASASSSWCGDGHDGLRWHADILLPDLFRFEQVSQIGTGGDNAYTISGQPCTTPKFERKTLYDALTSSPTRWA